MKYRTYVINCCFLAFCVFVSSFVKSQVLTVKQDGTGNFTQIQNAVDAALVGDTILVWPGEYTENVIIEAKQLTLASLYLTTNDDTYIDSTIINGNQTGSGIAIIEGTDTVVIIGFSIINGSGYPVYSDVIVGGGICVYNSFAKIISCHIHDNIAHDGGGGLCLWSSHVEIDNCRINNNFSEFAAGGVSCIFESFVYFRGTDIKNNHAYQPGGGIAIAADSEVFFDSLNRCNIYLNYASLGCDIHNAMSQVSKVYVDTFTVINPDSYFVSSINEFGYQQYDVEVDALVSKITPYDGNLYVNPVTGNDDNSGTHPDSALKTIAFAYTKMKIDSINKNTIHLANGIYSDSSNNEKFPLNIRPFVVVKGAGRDETILDGMFKIYMIRGNNEISNYTFSNMTMQRGTMVDYDNTFNNTDLFGFIYYDNNNITFDSIRFKNGIGKPGRGGLLINGSEHATVSNCIFENIKGLEALDISSSSGDTTYINNCIFDNNKPDINNPDWLYGKALRVSGAYDPDEPFIAVIQNCLFSNNDENAFLTANGLVYLINNTYVNNSLESIDVSAINNWASRGHMYNCISYNNGESPFLIWKLEGIPSDFSVFNSCIEGGEASFTVGQNSTLYYDETNIDTDPLFYYGSEYPYNLSNNSPCIDAGTMEIPEWIELYPYDLAGNPRVVGETIDMGAYEWNPTVVIDKNENIKKGNLLEIAPNPFTDRTTITAILKENSDVKVDIYSSNGQRVRQLTKEIVTLRTVELFWDGTNESGNECPQGLYILVLTQNNIIVDKQKVVKIDQ